VGSITRPDTHNWKAGQRQSVRIQFTVTTAGNIVNTGRITQVPIRLSDPNLARSAHTEDRFFDTSAFVAPAAFTLGNAGGNPAGGARLSKCGYVARQSLSRARTHVATLGAATLGRITSTTWEPRTLQLGLRLLY